jgi:pimeloyl-ACP methyl ester carboxylesterase
MISPVGLARPFAIVILTPLCLSGLPACAGGGRHGAQAGLIEYGRRVALAPRVRSSGPEGDLDLSWIDYSSSDGSTVPALLAVPTKLTARGCLIYQGGIGQPKEGGSSIRQGAAALGLATFTIDPRETGARGGPAQLRAVTQSPQGISAELNDSVVDLRRGLDYLDTRHECHHNIGYLGTGLGGQLGAVLAGEDARIKVVVLTSIGANWKDSLLAANEAARSHSGIPDTLPGIEGDPARLAAAGRILGPYDAARWVPRIAPRPLLLVNGRYDPLVSPVSALELAAAAQGPTSVMYFDGGHDPFAAGPGKGPVTVRIAAFLCTYLESCPGGHY